MTNGRIVVIISLDNKVAHYPCSPSAQGGESVNTSEKKRRFLLSDCIKRGISALFVLYIGLWRCIPISVKEDQAINEEIRDSEVRVVGADGSQLGIMSSEAALKLAQEQNYDLVKIAPTANPPVCKIMDYGKYRFEQQKREKEAKKNQKVVEIKEIRLSINIGDHDFETKLDHATKFLQDGNKVKASIRFRGREMAHASMGIDTMKRFAEALAEFGTVEKEAKLEGRSMQMFITPKPAK